MKLKFQDNGDDGEYDGTTSNGNNEIQWTEEDKEKGNLKKFNISKKTIKKLKARSIEFLFPIQTESYTSIYEQNDCLIQTTNSSGKTLAFAIPIVELLQSDKSFELTSGRPPRALIIVPTRDITKQISDDIQSIVNDLVVVSIYSGKKKSDDQETAIANGCDILVATPDRLKEFLDNEKVDLSTIKHVVLDEIDQMLEETIIDDVKKILKGVFTSDRETKPQLIVFSATSPDALRKLTKKYLSTDAVTINVSKTNIQEASADDEGFDETVNNSSGNVPTNTNDGSCSLLTKQENYTTYQLSTNEEIKSVGFVFTILRKCLGDDFDAKATVSQIAFTKDYTTAVFDLPSDYDEQIQNNWQNTARTKLAPATELPELDESSMTDNKSYSRGGGGGGGGNRNAGKSNGCFKCGKNGHKSFECPDASGFQRNGGNRTGGSGCFNCGKDGHKSFECPEPKKAGGGRSGGAGGQRSNACFNCGKEGHRSAECSEPRKAGGSSGACYNCGKDGHRSAECSEPRKAGGGRSGGGNACFNCGQEGHKSFECPEPKKGRPSGPGGRGGRGGARGGGAKRSFGGHAENGLASGETTNKKIKFNDDDD